MKVLLVDDHAILRAGLRLLLESMPDIEIVGEAGTATAAIDAAVSNSPDVVVFDLSMPGGGGLDAIATITERCPDTRVVVLTMHDDEMYLKAALAAGASGYVIKRSSESTLVDAVRAVHQGQRFVDAALEDVASLADATRPLSQREREVVRLLAQGYTNREASERLAISVKSVETYRARVVQKLGLRRRADLVRYAVDAGLLTSDTAPISQAV